MGVANWILLLFTHPNDFRYLLQFSIYHEQKRDITSMKEHPTSGWDRESMRRCWHFLDLTSRSFSAVIKELEGDLARTVSGSCPFMPAPFERCSCAELEDTFVYLYTILCHVISYRA